MLKRFLMNRALKLMERRPPDFVVGPSPDDPYMLRWWWIPRNRWLNVYVHAFLHDDDDRALHDHPWHSVSLLCKGWLTEFYKDKDGVVQKRTIGQGDITFRRAEFAHRLETPYKPPYDTPITIFVTGPVVRGWGFHCPNGWLPWREFVDPDNPGSPGRGCGETSE